VKVPCDGWWLGGSGLAENRAYKQSLKIYITQLHASHLMVQLPLARLELPSFICSITEKWDTVYRIATSFERER